MIIFCQKTLPESGDIDDIDERFFMKYMPCLLGCATQKFVSIRNLLNQLASLRLVVVFIYRFIR